MSRSPSMLVLTNCVYAKRKDGTLCPGSIEGKYDGSYTVMFGDSTREVVLEENVTWLAFWGLPPWCWPKNPVIQAIGKKSVSCANFQEEYVDVRKHRPASLTVLKNNDGRKSFPDNLSPPSHPSSTREQCCRTCQSFVVSSRQATKEDVAPHETLPTRSSVLRLNKKALHKDLGLNYVDSFPADTSLTEDLTETDISPPSSFHTTSEYVKNKRSPNDRVTTPMNMTKVSKSGNDEVTKWKSYHSRSSDMTKRKRRIEDRDTELDENEMLFHAGNPLLRLYPDKAYQSCDWYDTSPFKQVVPTPPIAPSSPSSSIELELPVFGQAAQKINWTSEEWMKNTSATGIGRRRRDDLKKCRKIYGVENRHLWCTQCRWKKACTRFKA